jgi:hypothetical protein
MFDRVWSTVARNFPLKLKAMVDTPRGGPDDSAVMLKAEELDDSAYSRLPSAVEKRSRHILGELSSI